MRPASVKFTNVDRLTFPDAAVTKRDILDYYDAIAPRLLPHLKDRPMTLERLPEGLSDESAPHFWQKNTPPHYPDWIPRIELSTEDGRRVKYLLVNDKRTLLYLVNQGTITFHPWFSTIDDPDRPTFVLFDIDPHQSTVAQAVRIAKVLRDVLEKERVEPFVKTSGKTGLHVMTPWKDRGNFDQARGWAAGVAARVVDLMPDIATTERHIRKRGQRVYLDVEQNAKGKHGVPPYVLRATPQATVSMPLKWTDLTARLDPKRFTIKTAMKRLEHKRDPLTRLV
jgi:bifunctional non-homologous end joining protein LigD